MSAVDQNLERGFDRICQRLDVLNGRVRETEVGLAVEQGRLVCGVTNCSRRTTEPGPIRFNGRARDATMVGVGGGGLLMAWQGVQAILRAIEGSPLP